MNGVPAVPLRPTEVWRQAIEEEARLVAAGELEEDLAVTAKLLPPELLLRLDGDFEILERGSSELSDAPDDTVLAVIRRTVFALNALNDEYRGGAIATDERDRICKYIDEVITEGNVDLDALCERRGLVRDELTDHWRTW
jgi:hypothetical protein